MGCLKGADACGGGIHIRNKPKVLTFCQFQLVLLLLNIHLLDDEMIYKSYKILTS